jgi:hypothetical protein
MACLRNAWVGRGWLLAPLVLVAVYACAVKSPDTRFAATRPADYSATRITIFDATSDHPWNRLHAALFVRTAPDRQEFGADEIDPLLWTNTTFLLHGDSHARAIAEMDGFLANDSAQLIHDPAKRAILQSELWAVFDWTAASRHPPEYEAAIGGLQSRLARIIAQLSLSDEQIRSLQDNYTQAVDSHRWADRFDPRAPKQPFLPSDLFQKNGPWVLINPAGRLGTPAHFELASGRSVFSVFIHLPGGRQATLDYLNRVNAFSQPLVLQSGQSVESRHIVLNPDFPQFPEGTQLALLRQMMLIDRNGELVQSHLVESLQIRVYRRIAVSLANSGDDPPQAFVEFLLRKSELFNGESGGLVAMKSGNKVFSLLMTMPFDPLEFPAQQHLPYRDQRRPALDCRECHVSAGVFSFQTCEQAVFANMGSPDLQESNIAYVGDITAGRKQTRYDWGLLKGLMREQE